MREMKLVDIGLAGTRDQSLRRIHLITADLPVPRLHLALRKRPKIKVEEMPSNTGTSIFDAH